MHDGAETDEGKKMLKVRRQMTRRRLKGEDEEGDDEDSLEGGSQKPGRLWSCDDFMLPVGSTTGPDSKTLVKRKDGDEERRDITHKTYRIKRVINAHDRRKSLRRLTRH